MRSIIWTFQWEPFSRASVASARFLPLVSKPPGSSSVQLALLCIDRIPTWFASLLTNMTEPFQAFASALATIEFALKLYRSLSTFVEKAQNAPKTAKGLVAEARRLRGTLYTVHLTLQVRKCQLANEKPTLAEQYIWKNIGESLLSWKQTLRRFKREMNELSIGAEGQRMSWADKVWWQLRHERKGPILHSLQGSMMDCIAQLSLSIQCLNL